MSKNKESKKKSAQQEKMSESKPIKNEMHDG
jgi:hypothetical protein